MSLQCEEPLRGSHRAAPLGVEFRAVQQEIDQARGGAYPPVLPARKSCTQIGRISLVVAPTRTALPTISWASASKSLR
ncbi:hypothetical protein [Streptomyces sp. NPDC001415]